MDNTNKHLQDILTAVEEIGEAMNRILKSNADVHISNARKIVDARNYIIHGYDSLSVDILWSIVINHLPKLKAEVTELLKYNRQIHFFRPDAHSVGILFSVCRK